MNQLQCVTPLRFPYAYKCENCRKAIPEIPFKLAGIRQACDAVKYGGHVQWTILYCPDCP